MDISAQLGKKIDANRANVAKGPGGHLGSKLRAEMAKRNQRLPLLGESDLAADRNYIKEFVLARNRELGRQYGVEYAESSTTFQRAHPALIGTRESRNTSETMPFR